MSWTAFLYLASQGSNVQEFLDHSETENYLTLKSISRSYFLLGLKPDSGCDLHENSGFVQGQGMDQG